MTMRVGAVRVGRTQLKQGYVVVPAKLRLVEFNAILKRALVRQTTSPKIFFSPAQIWCPFPFKYFLVY